MKTTMLSYLALVLLCPFVLNATEVKIRTAHQKMTIEKKKTDILFVIDNSGSMESSQAELAKAMGLFTERLQKSDLDYRIAVTGTDAWRAAYQSNTTNKNMLQRVRPGKLDFSKNPLQYINSSGVFVVTPETPNLVNVLANNLSQGTTGTGDERAFASFKQVLNYSGNSDFRRPDAKLFIVILSDEDDFSSNTSSYVAGQYNEEVDSDPVVLPVSSSPTSLYKLYQDSRLDTVSSYKTFLDGYEGAGNYSVSMIGILDPQCKATLNTEYGGRRIGRRYMELSQLTNGTIGSLCAIEDSIAKFADHVAADAVVDAPVFEIKLDRQPLPGTLVVKINGRLILEDAKNGWSFEPSTLILKLNGSSVPQEGDAVSITYDFEI